MKTSLVKLAVIAVLFQGSVGLASTLTCTLESGSESDTVSLQLGTPDAEEGLYAENGVLDLNFYVQAECNEGLECTAFVVFDSQILEDEAGSTGFDFNADGEAKNLLVEPLTETPDGNAYTFSCNYSPN